MSKKIMKGIEEAQIDLSKEKQKKDEEVCTYSRDVWLVLQHNNIERCISMLIGPA